MTPPDLELGIQEKLKLMGILSRIEVSDRYKGTQLQAFTMRLPQEVAERLRKLPGKQIDHIERALRLYLAVIE
jgi:hypothetical protein